MYFNREVARSRKYNPWEPPSGNEERHGKKIIVKKQSDLGVIHEELD
jgi:hypothetical protein